MKAVSTFQFKRWVIHCKRYKLCKHCESCKGCQCKWCEGCKRCEACRRYICNSMRAVYILMQVVPDTQAVLNLIGTHANGCRWAKDHVCY